MIRGGDDNTSWTRDAVWPGLGRADLRTNKVGLLRPGPCGRHHFSRGKGRGREGKKKKKRHGRDLLVCVGLSLFEAMVQEDGRRDLNPQRGVSRKPYVIASPIPNKARAALKKPNQQPNA